MINRRSLDIAAPEVRETPFYGIPAVPAEEGATQSPAKAPRRELADCATGLSQDQIAEFRHRLARGFYASPAVVREVARRLLESGDM